MSALEWFYERTLPNILEERPSDEVIEAYWEQMFQNPAAISKLKNIFKKEIELLIFKIYNILVPEKVVSRWLFNETSFAISCYVTIPPQTLELEHCGTDINIKHTMYVFKADKTGISIYECEEIN